MESEKDQETASTLADALAAVDVSNVATCGGATSAVTANWGPGQVVDPGLSSTAAGDASTSKVIVTSDDSLANWVWRAQHELPRWGGQSDDLAAVGLPDKLVFSTFVTAELKCKQCGSRDSVQMLKHHPGGCGAFEWTHGIDIDWRWTCCGKHENFCHEKACTPTGSHPKTGCVQAPLCVACFVCPCAQLIATRKRDLIDMYAD